MDEMVKLKYFVAMKMIIVTQIPKTRNFLIKKFSYYLDLFIVQYF